MKAKILYFYELNKTKIILGGLVLVCLIGSMATYKVINSLKNSEKIEISHSEDVVLVTEKDEKDTNVEEVESNGEQEIKEDVNEKDEKVKIYVDIKGEVKTPGVYIMEEDSRISDVIKKAGGVTKLADTSVNNLSRKVKDEMVIIIYSKEEVENFVETKEKEGTTLEEAEKNGETIPNDSIIQKEEIDTSKEQDEVKDNDESKEEDKTDSENSSNAEITKKISINTATKEELMGLSGIGESKALAIIDYRETNGKFEKIEDLLEVSGIGNALFAKIKDFIEV